MLVLSSLFLAFINFWILYSRRTKSIFNPIKIFSFFLAVYYTLPSVLFSIFSYENPFSPIEKSLLTYQNFLIIAFVIVVIFVSGLIKKRNIKTFNYDYSSQTVFVVAIALMFLGLYVKIQLFLDGLYSVENKMTLGPSRLTRIQVFLRNIDLWGFLILSPLIPKLVYKRQKPITKLIYFTYLLVLIYFSIIQGRRTGVILPILTVMASFILYKKSSIKKLIALGGILIASLVSVTYNRVKNAGISFSQDVVQILMDSILARLFNPYTVLNKVIEQGSINDISGFSLILKGFVPSFLYPNKPDLSIGNEFGKSIGLIRSNDNFTGINPGWLAEGYYYFNFFGIVLSAIIFSLLLSVFSKNTNLKYESSVLFLLLLIQLLSSGFQMEIAASTNFYFKTAIILWLITSFFSRLKVRT